MKKATWVRPALDLVTFEANDYVCSNCLAQYSGILWCSLPEDPNHIKDYTPGEDEVFREFEGFQGALNGDRSHGACSIGASFVAKGNSATGYELAEGHTDAWISNMVIGDQLTFVPTSASDIDIYDPITKKVDIGTPISNLTDAVVAIGQWFKATWFSSRDGFTWRHAGLAQIQDVTYDGNPNRS